MEHKIYKIRKRGTRLYSNGGTYPSFTKRGKTWSIGDLKKHLNIVSNETRNVYNTECEVVEFTESERGALSFSDI